MRNYDTTSHNPFPRVLRIIVDGGGRLHLLAACGMQIAMQVDMAEFDTPRQVVHPATGAAIPGQTSTLREVLLGITAHIRHDQIRRDAEQDAQQAPTLGPQYGQVEA